MNEMISALSTISAGVAGALFSAIWEGALLAVVVYIGLRLIPGLSAAARSLVVGSSRVDLQACKLEYSIVSPK